MGPRPLNHFGVLWVMMIDEVVEPPASLDGVLIRARIDDERAGCSCKRLRIDDDN